jgi:hypothetical protein
MMVATEYKGSIVVAEPYDASLIDFNWIHDPSGQNGGITPKMVLEIGTILMIVDDSDWKGYLLSFPCICRTSKMEVICNMDVNLNTR